MKRDPRAVAETVKKCNYEVTAEQILSQPATWFEASMALRFAWNDFVEELKAEMKRLSQYLPNWSK